MRRALESRAVAIAGWIVLTPLAALSTLRLVAHDASLPLMLANAFTTWLYLPVWAVLAVALTTRRPHLAQVSAAVATLHLVWSLPGVLAVGEPDGTVHAPRLRVMSANLLGVNRDTDGIVGEVLAERPDVLVVQELTPHWHTALEDARVRALLPHRAHVVRTDSFGIGVYSRLRLERSDVLALEGLPLLRASVRVGGESVRLYAVHTLPPRSPGYARTWERMMAGLEAQLGTERGAVIVAGDLNATPHARWYQRLTAGRLRGAHEDRGRGLATTWPNGHWSVPPIRLDHVLVSPEISCLDVREGVGRGSDHRPVVVDVAIRKPAGPLS